MKTYTRSTLNKFAQEILNLKDAQYLIRTKMKSIRRNTFVYTHGLTPQEASQLEAYSTGEYGEDVVEDVPETKIETKRENVMQKTMEKSFQDSSELINDNSGVYVPEKNESFVRFGIFSDLNKIIKSKRFMPTLIVGDTGNGKTEAARQSCAINKRTMVQVNFNSETDETQLIGSLKLVEGNTVFKYGAVVDAMREGAVLILDEIDNGSPHLINCMNDVLCGHSLYIKETGELIHPEKGFQVIATANTKGKGDITGNYIGTNILNEAFLDRFIITLEQEYPTESQEKKILSTHCAQDEIEISEKNIKDLARWGAMVRHAYKEDKIDVTLSTRKLIAILDTFSVFGDIAKSVQMSISRFDDEVKSIMANIYQAISGESEEVSDEVEETMDYASKLGDILS